MAEEVERRLEESLDEIVYIKKAKLLKKHELSELIRRRRKHEYSLQKRNKRVLDYDSYIMTELTILKLLRFRRKETEDRRFIEKIERSIITRLVRLHRQLCYRFQSRIDLWMRFIKFSCILGRHMSAVRLWNRVLQVHGRTDPRLWAAAASYHLHRNANAKIRSNLSNMAKEIDQLTDKETKLRQELNALNRYVKKKDQNKVENLVEELRETCAQLKKASLLLRRQRRITTDRVYLNAIREARRLLTEGLALNPECDLLHLELVKLELACADFFKSRIFPRLNRPSNERTQSAKKTDHVTESNTNGAAASGAINEADVSTDVKQTKKLRNRVPEKVLKDNKALLAEVTEDIPFVASGGALNLVLRSLLNRQSDNQVILQGVKEITSTVPHLVDEQIHNELKERLEKLTSEHAMEVEPSSQDIKTASHDICKTLLDQATQLNQVVMNDSPMEAVRLWDSWYTHPKTGVDLFRTVNPKLNEAIGLFRTRLSIATLQANWCFPVEPDSGSTVPKKQELLCRTRSWLDGLATSQWGEQCPDFWIQYLSFERDHGDCTRLPALQWRASKLLNPEAYRQFTHLLTTSNANPFAL